MSLDYFHLLEQKVIKARKLRGLTISILSKQARIRQELLQKLEEAGPDYVFSKPEQRQILKLAHFLKIEFDSGQSQIQNLPDKQSLGMFQTSTSSAKVKNIFFVFTSKNFNLVLLTLVSFGVLFLVGLPAFLVVRPAELFWSDLSTKNNTLEIGSWRRTFSGTTARAKTMTFGDQNIILNEGAFSLDLPKPSQPTMIPLLLTNYFNLTTEYKIILKPV